MPRVVIIGGGPGGYEAALVAAQHDAQVTLVERAGLGGAAVLTDCVPSKTLIAVSDVLNLAGDSGQLGVRIEGGPASPDLLGVDLHTVNARVVSLARAQSADIRSRLASAGVSIIEGHGEVTPQRDVLVRAHPGSSDHTLIPADVVLVATGARPRLIPGAEPDGERILTWTQLYGLNELPDKLIVIGSGVTGAEFASGYRALGSQVLLVSSREQVLPGQDADAAEVLEHQFRERQLEVSGRSRAAAVTRTSDGVLVDLTDGRQLIASHTLLAVGSVPNTSSLGLSQAGIVTDPGGFIAVDRVSRTSAPGVYAAGDCTGVMMLASVAAMQGRIAMWHALGQAVRPLDLRTVSASIFTDPEIASVGVSQQEVDDGLVDAVSVLLPLQTNPRAKMQGIHHGFVKLLARRDSRVVIGGVIVAPRASELVHPITLAVDHHLTVAQLAETFTVYPSLSGSIAEAARQLRTD